MVLDFTGALLAAMERNQCVNCVNDCDHSKRPRFYGKHMKFNMTLNRLITSPNNLPEDKSLESLCVPSQIFTVSSYTLVRKHWPMERGVSQSNNRDHEI